MAQVHARRPIRGNVTIVDRHGDVILEGRVEEAEWTERRDVNPITYRGELVGMEEGEHTVDFKLKISDHSFTFNTRNPVAPIMPVRSNAALWNEIEKLTARRHTMGHSEYLEAKTKLIAELQGPINKQRLLDNPDAEQVVQQLLDYRKMKNLMFAAAYGGGLKLWANDPRKPINVQQAGLVGMTKETTRNHAERSTYYFDLGDSW